MLAAPLGTTTVLGVDKKPRNVNQLLRKEAFARAEQATPSAPTALIYDNPSPYLRVIVAPIRRVPASGHAGTLDGDVGPNISRATSTRSLARVHPTRER